MQKNALKGFFVWMEGGDRGTLLSLEDPTFSPFCADLLAKEKPDEDDIFGALDGEPAGEGDDKECAESWQVWFASWFVCYGVKLLSG